MIYYIITLIATILIESFIFWILIKKEPVKLLVYSIIINSLTVPLANYGYQAILNNFIVIEIIVVLAESILIMLLLKIGYRRALIISFVANLITALISIVFWI